MRISGRHAALLVLSIGWATSAAAYENIKVAVYARAQEVSRMSDPAWLEREWQRIAGAVHVDKIYLEVHRDGRMLRIGRRAVRPAQREREEQQRRRQEGPEHGDLVRWDAASLRGRGARSQREVFAAELPTPELQKRSPGP